jgi:hypothetical protein
MLVLSFRIEVHIMDYYGYTSFQFLRLLCPFDISGRYFMDLQVYLSSLAQKNA